jgi:Mg2+ and Co2+ transporter CorA
MDQDERMVIITDPAGIQALRRGQAACVLVDAQDAALLEALGTVLPDPRSVRVAVNSRRPLVHVDDSHVAVLTFVADGWDARRRIFLLASGDLLVVVGDEFALDLARRAVTAARRPADGLAKTLAAVARAAEADLDRTGDAEADRELSLVSNRLISGDARREVSRRRARLFEWRQLYAGQARLLDDDEPLADALGDEIRTLLRPARSSFQYAADVADRLYAVLGDVLSEQNAMSSQRLTLVSTVFLPLTVSTGFFGMNFGWLTDHIGSPAAFFLLAVVAPVLFVLGTLGFVRRYGA